VRIGHRDHVLEVSVHDAGSAVGAWVPGVGLSSMRERVAEVGETLQLTTGKDGSLVRADLPLY
jgi:two-component system, NarL family, sensor kinase